MAATFETATSSTTGTVSITPAGTDRVLYMFAGVDVATDQSLTVTFAGSGTGITNLAGGGSNTAPTETAGTGHYLAGWRLIAPAASAGDVVVTGASNIVAAVALSGVDQVTPNDAVTTTEATTGATTGTITITSAVDDLVVGAGNVNSTNTAVLAMTNGTLRTEASPAGGHVTAIGTAVGAASVDAVWTWTGNRAHGFFSFNVNAAAGAPPYNPAELGWASRYEVRQGVKPAMVPSGMTPPDRND